MQQEDQLELLAYCRNRNIQIIADEVYHRHFSAQDAAPSFLEVAEEDDPVVVVNGFSKAWAMTGWRLGWVVTPKAQATHWAIMSECFNTGAPAFVQIADITALRQGESHVQQLKSQYEQARKIVVEKFSNHPAIELAAPDGTFYAFPKIRGVSSSRKFVEGLLAEEDVGVAPGYTFGEGNDGHIRLCYAPSHERLADGLHRILRYIDRHHSF